MDQPRHDLLAGTRLAGDEYRGIALGRQGDLLLAHREHGIAAADQFAHLGGGGVLPALRRGAPGQRLLHGSLQQFGLHRLVDEVAGAILDRLDGQFQVVHAGHHDDARLRAQAAQFGDQFVAEAIGQLLVEEDEIGLCGTGQFERIGAGDGAVDAETLLLEVEREHFAQGDVVLHDEQARFHDRSGSFQQPRASSAQPARKASPPRGVTMPSERMPVSASR